MKNYRNNLLNTGIGEAMKYSQSLKQDALYPGHKPMAHRASRSVMAARLNRLFRTSKTGGK